MLNSVRLSLLLACTAVCTAPGLLPVAGFPQVSSSRFRCAMLIAITCARGLEDELPAPGGVWEAKSRWPLAVGSFGAWVPC